MLGYVTMLFFVLLCVDSLESCIILQSLSISAPLLAGAIIGLGTVKSMSTILAYNIS